jgi:hypothetical protein
MTVNGPMTRSNRVATLDAELGRLEGVGEAGRGRRRVPLRKSPPEAGLRRINQVPVILRIPIKLMPPSFCSSHRIPAIGAKSIQTHNSRP